MGRFIRVASLLLAGCSGEVSTGATSDGPAGSMSDAPTGAGTSDAPVVPMSLDAAPTGPVAEVHFIGRFETSDSQGPRFGYPGTAILTRFDGTGIDVDLVDPGDNRFAVVIDQGAPAVIDTGPDQTRYTLASGLSDGPHDLGLYRRTETYQGVVQFRGFFPHGDRPLLATAAPPARHLEIIGDSISCGYGNEGTSPCDFSAGTENEYLTYGAIAARTLGATHTDICYSGKGAYTNYGGSTEDAMPEVYFRTIADWPEPLWDTTRLTPDVIVVNLGTNDFSGGDPGQPYVDAMLAFTRTLRMRYPQAKILLAVGSMLSGGSLTIATGYVVGVVQTLRDDDGDDGVSYVEFQPQGSVQGCNSHPSLATHQDMAEVLVPAVRAVTGW